MRGIELHYHEDQTLCLKNLLYNVPIEKYIWSVSEDEIIIDNNAYVLPREISGSALREFLENPSSLFIFAKLTAYPNSNHSGKEVKDYTDFSTSLCEIVILIYDGLSFEIYSKREDVLLQIIENAKKDHCIDIVIKTESSDSRIIFNVF